MRNINPMFTKEEFDKHTVECDVCSGRIEHAFEIERITKIIGKYMDKMDSRISFDMIYKSLVSQR